MRTRALFVALVGAAHFTAAATQVAARQVDPVDHTEHMAMPDTSGAGVPAPHDMWYRALPGGWTLAAMGQAFPILTAGLAEEGSPLRETSLYLTQPALMGSLRSPGSRVALRLTLNFEGITQEKGELNYGGWGEGFIDKRHPHSLLHEAMVTLNFLDESGSGGSGAVGTGAASLSFGRGFAPYGTDDPMGRPALKYPTNHHLSQVLERWTVNAQLLRGPWSFEAGVFAGGEPEGSYDLGNTADFGRSWSARVIRRWGTAGRAWEVGASHASVVEPHDGGREWSRVTNGSLRYEGMVGSGGDAEAGQGTSVYALAEFSWGGPVDSSAYYSALVESGVVRGRHLPYLRLERATRPEFPREDPAAREGFFRYPHDAEAEAATAWWIVNVGYGFAASTGAVAIRPFVDLQWHRAALDRGAPSTVPAALIGESLWALSVGARIFLGGGPMRMGSYGLLDGMVHAGHDAGAAP